MTKWIGSLLIIVGTSIGAGMLALPIVSSQVGFPTAAVILILTWALMLTTGLLVLETCLVFDLRRNNFSTMAKETLGRPAQWLAALAVMLLLYSLTGAYISGSSSLIHASLSQFGGIHFPHWVDALVFTLVFGSVVLWSTSLVDLLNRLLISVKGIALVIVLTLLMPHVNLAYLATKPGHIHYIWGILPIFLTAFGTLHAN